MNDIAIICGSGNTVSIGMDFGIFDELQNHFTFGLNYWYKYAFDPDIITFLDWQFYNDNYEDLREKNIIVGRYRHELLEKHENTYLVPTSHIFHGKDSWNVYNNVCLQCRHEFKDDYSKPKRKQCPKCQSLEIYDYGFYCHKLSGTFALSLAISLGFKEIYLLE